MVLDQATLDVGKTLGQATLDVGKTLGDIGIKQSKASLDASTENIGRFQ